jgi:hypothetical protein
MGVYLKYNKKERKSLNGISYIFIGSSKQVYFPSPNTSQSSPQSATGEQVRI